MPREMLCTMACLSHMLEPNTFPRTNLPLTKNLVLAHGLNRPHSGYTQYKKNASGAWPEQATQYITNISLCFHKLP